MPTSPTIGKISRDLRKRLASCSETPGLDTQVLLSHILGRPKTWVLTHPEVILTQPQKEALEASMRAIQAGTPLPYILGEWEFFGLSFKITPEVLIPRPETELLVETALKWLGAHPEKKRCADLGTGSGCIAVSLAANFPSARVSAIDISARAINIAKFNAKHHRVEDQITFLNNDLFENLPGIFDLICSNPPYIPTSVLHKLKVFGHEPTLALDGGPDGLDVIRKIFIQSSGRISSLENQPGKLAENGLLLIEIEATLGKSVLKLASQYFPAANIRLLPDLAGRDRLVYVENI